VSRASTPKAILKYCPGWKAVRARLQFQSEYHSNGFIRVSYVLTIQAHKNAYCIELQARKTKEDIMPEKMSRSEAGRKGGEAAHEKGTAHEFSTEEARVAGRKGGAAAHARGTAHEFSSKEAKTAGHKGGAAAHEKGTAHEFSSKEAKAAGHKGGSRSSR
jgi:general stress protein YciG